jgi:hypothetical protein
MASRFAPGTTVYTKDGRSYVVEDVDDGVVYCKTAGGAETEFPETSLLNEAEWAAKSGGRRDLFYTRLRQARAYSIPTGTRDQAISERLLAKVDRLSPGLLDFAAFTVAERAMVENGDRALVSGLSIPKCREVFDMAAPEARVSLLAGMLGMTSDALVDAGRLGDNLMRALIDKGLAANAAAFEAFCDRPRR